ncbi:MAG: DUF1178 family protein [Proteobacteria bacterium]|nr:DUF1178 family protein [Pseudomonadota bacterium]
MIVFDLACDKGHVFEAWFKDSATFERQAKRGQVACGLCGSAKVSKAPMAPRIATRKGAAPVPAPTQADTASPEAAPGVPADAPAAPPAAFANSPEAAKAAQLMKELSELRRHVEKNCEHVGPRFAEEARKMHYGEAKKRNIYGDATDADAKSLNEEGIEFSRVPWMPRHDS